MDALRKRRATADADSDGDEATSYDGMEPPQRQRGPEVLSNLPLQMSLYFHLFYLPMWFVVIVSSTQISESPYVFGDSIGGGIYPLIFVVEVARLALGYQGNLRESAPGLIGFFIGSALFELPLFLVVLQRAALTAFELGADILLLVFLCCELVLGLLAVRHVQRERAHRFKILYQGLLYDELQELPGNTHETEL